MNDEGLRATTEEVFSEANRARWDELVSIHADSQFYDLAGFKSGKLFLNEVELKELGDIRGKRILHLQCHFGLTTLSLARLGAVVTGVDFSQAAVDFAIGLSQQTGIPSEFVCCDVQKLSDALVDRFDIVFCSYGILSWLHDLDAWARGIVRSLVSGGAFYMVEEHPYTEILEGAESPRKLRISRSYFGTRIPTKQRVVGSYANRSADVVNVTAYLWQHSVSDVLNAFARQEMTLDYFNEFPFSVYCRFDGMVKDGVGNWALNGEEAIPYLFSVKFIKCSRAARE